MKDILWWLVTKIMAWEGISMVEVYVTLVIYGKKDISQVPDRYRDAVVKMLGVLDGEEI